MAVLISYSTCWTANLSLQTAIKKALQHSDDQALLKLENQTLEAKFDELIASTLPTIDFTTGIQYTLQSSKGFLNNPSLANMQNSNSQSNTFSSLPKYLNGQSYNWGLTIKQPLNIARLGTVVKMGSHQKDILSTELDIQRSQLALASTQTFLQIISLQRLLQTQNKIAIIQNELWKRSQIDLKHGSISLHTLKQIKNQTKLKNNEVKNLEAQIKITKLKFAHVLRIQQIDTLTLSENTLAKLAESSLSAKNPELIIAEKQTQYATANVSYQNSYFYPNLNLIGSVNNTVNKTNDLPTGASETDFYDPDFFNYRVGLELSWNLFNGWGTNSKKRIAEIEVRKSALNQNKVENRIAEQIQELRLQIPLLLNIWETSKIQEALQWDQHLLDQEDYKNGQIRFAELLRSEQKILQASYQTNQSLNQYILSLMQLRIFEGSQIGSIL
jgi:outer membrane protein TolC